MRSESARRLPRAMEPCMEWQGVVAWVARAVEDARTNGWTKTTLKRQIARAVMAQLSWRASALPLWDCASSWSI